MLGKLLKYDLKNVSKFLIIFYSLSIFFAILTRILFSIENSFIMNIIAQICSGATIAMIINILINNTMRLWVRFKNTLYDDESYLTNTLPVERKTIYLSKVLLSIITMLASIVVIGITLFIAYYSKENIEFIKTLLLPMAGAYNSTVTSLLILLLAVFFIEFINIIQNGYTGIILGHKMNNYKTAYSVLFGFAVYMGIQVVLLLVVFLVGLFNSDLMNLFMTNTILNVDMVKWVAYGSIILYSIIFIIFIFVNMRLLKKGVNID